MRFRKVVQFIAPIVVFVFAWEAFSRSGRINIDLFPPPSAVFIALVDLIKSGEYLKDILWSVMRAVLGFCLGAFLGIVLGVLTGRIPAINRSLTPLIQVFRPIPSIAFVPLAIVWFGLGEQSKVFLVMWGVFFPVWINTFLGVTSVENTYIWAAKSLGAPDRKIMIEVVLPAALPLIVAGMRVGVALAFLNLVAAEMAGAYVGLGYRVGASHMVFRIDQMITGIIGLGLLGALSDRVFAVIIRRVVPWYRSGA
jgi:ABC-type nitrate/sulfonate/bicarbonate transport system permease component